MTGLHLIISPPPIGVVSSIEREQPEPHILPIDLARQFEVQSYGIELTPTPWMELMAIGGLLAASIANAMLLLIGFL